jgi:hypothetical protein
MGSEQQHREKAESNARFFQAIESLGFPDWSATAIFYQAVHLAELVLARRGVHTRSHQERRRAVRTMIPRVWNDYLLLDNYSRWARYGFKQIKSDRDIPRLLAALQVIRREAGVASS